MTDWLVNDALPLAARICLVAIFPFSGLDKIVNWDNALKQAASSFLPGAPVLLVLAMMVELGTPICIVSGWYDGLAAVVLAGYCAVTAILYHNFWSHPRFWSPDSAGYPHLWDFLKNFGLVGGLLLLILGGNLAKADTAASGNCQTADRSSTEQTGKQMRRSSGTGGTVAGAAQPAAWPAARPGAFKRTWASGDSAENRNGRSEALDGRV